MLALSLTSPWFIWGMRIALAAIVVFVVWRWPRAAGPGWWAVARRLLALAAVSALTVVNVIAPLNAEYGWYPTLGDVVPWRSQEPGTTTSQGADAANVAKDHVASSSLISGPRARTAIPLHLTQTLVGGYQDFQVPGPRSGVTGTVTVGFPPSYTTTPARDRSYPVIELFHGFPPSPYAFFTAAHLDQMLQSATAGHQLREAVVVVPHWAPGGQDNECVDTPSGVPGGLRMETWLTQDVPAWVYSTFRVQPGRESWNALGYSAGGWCANMASMLHPDVFASGISFGAYWQPVFGADFRPFAVGSKEWERYNLLGLQRRHPPAVALWTLYSVKDHLSAPTSAEIVRLVRPPTSLTAVTLAQGGHATSVWIPYFPQALAWLGANSPGFAPG